MGQQQQAATIVPISMLNTGPIENNPTSSTVCPTPQGLPVINTRSKLKPKLRVPTSKPRPSRPKLTSRLTWGEAHVLEPGQLRFHRVHLCTAMHL